jgi:hypothetical protein
MPTIILDRINPSLSPGLAPSIFNSNFEIIEEILNDIGELFLLNNKKIALSGVVAIPNNSFEGATIALVGESGFPIIISPNGTGATFSVTFDGKIAASNITLSGIGSDRSSIQDLLVSGEFEIEGPTSFNEKVDFSKPDFFLVQKQTIFSIISNNIGSLAPAPVDFSKSGLALLDCSNGGNNLSSGQIKLDTSNFEENQEINIRLFIKNSTTSIGFYNGTSGNQIFATIDCNNSGYYIIPHTVIPTFDTSGSGYCWMKCRWIEISTGVFRLVIIESSNLVL